MQLIEITQQAEWDELVANHPYGHPLQLWGWGEAKGGNGWTAHRLAARDEHNEVVGGVQVLLWRIPRLGRFIAYVPRGPVVQPGSEAADQVLAGLVTWARSRSVLYIRIEPAWTDGRPGRGWRKAKHHLQLAETYTIDLSKDEAALLEPMSRKHRQYIRKSERDGVSVRRETSDNLAPMYELYEATARRAGFGIHPKSYYEALHRALGERSYLYYAYADGKPVAFLWLAGAGRTVYELYGGVNENGAELKANYFLKWQAMTWLKEAHYVIYDFNGRLNEGVSRFKDGFGPDETDYIGTYDYPFNLAGYHVWEHLWPVVKVVGRKLAK